MATTYTVESYLDALNNGESVDVGSTISDTAQAIKWALDGGDLTNVGAITITDTAFALTPTQYDLLTQHGWALAVNQTFTLEVTAEELLAQVDAQGFSQSDTFALVDTAQNIDLLLNLSSYYLSWANQAGLTAIKANDDGDITLIDFNSINQLSCKIETDGDITVWLAADYIWELIGSTNFAALKSYGVTIIDAMDGELDLTSDQYDTFKASGLLVKYNDVVTVNGERVYDINLAPPYETRGNGVAYFNDSNEFHVAAHNATFLSQLKDAGVTTIGIKIDAPLLLTLEEVRIILEAGLRVYNGVSVTLDVSVSDLKDTNKLAAITAAGLPVNVTEPTWSLKVAEFNAVKAASITFVAGESITISDTAENLQSADFAALKTAGATGVTVSDNLKLTLSAEKATTITLPIASLSDAGLDRIDADNNTVTLDALKAKALGSIVFDASDTVTIKDSATNLGETNLAAADITREAANGVDWLLSDETNHTLSLTVAQYRALVQSLTTALPLKLTGTDIVTLSDTAANLTLLTAIEIGICGT